VKRAADLQKMMDISEFAQNSSMPKEKPVEEELTRAQAVFSQITQLMSHNQRPVVSDLNQTLSQLEADLRQDGQKIFNMKNGAQNAYVRKHGAGKK